MADGFQIPEGNIVTHVMGSGLRRPRGRLDCREPIGSDEELEYNQKVGAVLLTYFCRNPYHRERVDWYK